MINNFLHNRFGSCQACSPIEVPLNWIQILLPMWSLVWRYRLYSFALDALLAVECTTSSVILKRSGNHHPHAGIGDFADRHAGKVV